MIDLHPGIPDVNTAFGDVNQQIAPVAGFDTSRFVAEAKSGMSTWDLYLGATRLSIWRRWSRPARLSRGTTILTQRFSPTSSRRSAKKAR